MSVRWGGCDSAPSGSSPQGALCFSGVLVGSRQLRRKRPKGGQRPLRDIAAELAASGIFNERGGAVLGAVDQLDAEVAVLGVDAEIASSV